VDIPYNLPSLSFSAIWLHKTVIKVGVAKDERPMLDKLNRLVKLWKSIERGE
jgi:hypothetical protein